MFPLCGTSLADAAIAQVTPGAVDPDGKILAIGTLSADTLQASLDLPVKKSGRTSGLTRGRVAGLNATVSVGYSDECAGASFTTTFTGQILVSPGKFIKSGDSGSLMVEDVATNPRAVGLLYAGSKRIAVANPIDDVLNYFDVSMVGVPGAGGAGASASGPGASAQGLENAAQAQVKHGVALMNVPGAVGHAIGLGNGACPVVRVLVDKITPAAQQAAPRNVDGVPVVLWEVGVITAY